MAPDSLLKSAAVQPPCCVSAPGDAQHIWEHRENTFKPHVRVRRKMRSMVDFLSGYTASGGKKSNSTSTELHFFSFMSHIVKQEIGKISIDTFTAETPT